MGTSEVKAGAPIEVTVIVANASSKTLTVESCASDGWLWVGLANETTPFTRAVAAVACNPSVRLKPGDNRFRVPVMTVYQECEVHVTPRGTKSGSPPPKGTYHTVVVTLT